MAEYNLHIKKNLHSRVEKKNLLSRSPTDASKERLELENRELRRRAQHLMQLVQDQQKTIENLRNNSLRKTKSAKRSLKIMTRNLSPKFEESEGEETKKCGFRASRLERVDSLFKGDLLPPPSTTVFPEETFTSALDGSNMGQSAQS